MNLIYQNNNINNINTNVPIQENEININNNNKDCININNNLDKNEEYLSLEELWVREVDDDIFGENFDESNLPILKKIIFYVKDILLNLKLFKIPEHY